MKIVTWNINGIRARLPIVLDWLKQNQPDIIGLQEIKCQNENFPTMEFEELGYNVKIFGQKSFNGVALLSKIPFDEITRGLDGDESDEQARLIEGVFSTKNGVVRVCNIYLPNGNPVNGGGVGVESEANNGDLNKQPLGGVGVESEASNGDLNKQPLGGVGVESEANNGDLNKQPLGGVGVESEASSGNKNNSDKFLYKLKWMDRLNEYVAERLKFEEPFILMGDFNIIPADIDCHNPKAWWGDALYRPESLEKFRTLLNLGMTDALRAVSEDQNYSFWDFQAGAWRKNNGIRIDFLLLNAQAADRLKYVKTHKEVRALERPSDHVPVEGEFEL